MLLVNIITVMVLFFSFFGGLKEGAVRNGFSLIILLIAIPGAGASYHLVAGILSFLPGDNWQNFIGFFVTMGVITIIAHILFFLPRRIIQTIWKKGVFFRLTGGALNVCNAAISITVFRLVLGQYPIIDWLAETVNGAAVVNWLVAQLGFVSAMLPFPATSFPGTY